MRIKSSTIQKKLGEKIREARGKLEISQEELGFRTGLDRTYISGIERGIRNPSIRNIGKIARALKVPLSKLVSF